MAGAVGMTDGFLRVMAGAVGMTEGARRVVAGAVGVAAGRARAAGAARLTANVRDVPPVRSSPTRSPAG